MRVLADEPQDRCVGAEPGFITSAHGFDFDHALSIALARGDAFAFAGISGAEEDYPFL
jgi:hypothetical protein